MSGQPSDQPLRRFPLLLACALMSALVIAGCNRRPRFEVPFRYSHGTALQYDRAGNLTGAVTTITSQAAKDANGDSLSYAWRLDPQGVGTITGNGVVGTWGRVIEEGRPKPGTAVVTVSDGRGGVDSALFRFE